jgi:SAM-dependent methyltransferase
VGDRNQEFYGGSLRFFSGKEPQLFPTEASIIERFDGSWSSIRMLDIGIGAGRTTTYFAPLAGEYVGVDYGAAFIEHCREVFGESDTVRFAVADARELDGAGLGTFDFILFSFNGIDYSDHLSRLRVLRNIRGALNRQGWFLFSSHSLFGVSKWWSSPRASWRHPVHSLVAFGRALVKAPFMLWLNRRVDLEAGRAQGHVILNDGAHRLSLTTYYIDPAEQLVQLADAGFFLVAAFNPAGDVIDPLETGERGWISYLVRPIGA